MISFGSFSPRRALGALAVAAAFAAPAAARAQTPMNVSVTVNSALSVSVQQALLFGVLVPGSNLTIDASTSASAGRYEISGTAAANVNVTITYPATLTAGSDFVNLSTYTAAFSSTVGGSRTALPSAVGQTITSSPSSISLSGAGFAYIWIGSKVTIPPSTPAGTYSGTVSMTANY